MSVVRKCRKSQSLHNLLGYAASAAIFTSLLCKGAALKAEVHDNLALHFLARLRLVGLMLTNPGSPSSQAHITAVLFLPSNISGNVINAPDDCGTPSLSVAIDHSNDVVSGNS